MYYFIETLRLIGDITIKVTKGLGYVVGALLLWAWLYCVLVLVLAL